MARGNTVSEFSGLMF